MATYKQLQDEVRDLVVDLPAHVSTYVPSLVNEAIRDLQVEHNFRVMRAQHVANTSLASHTVGNLPANWKAPRDEPYYVTQAGGEVDLQWAGNEEAELVQHYSLTDATDKGPPQHLFMRSIDEQGTLQLEVYPFPDGLADWTAVPVGEYRLVVPYWRFTADLVNDTDTNWFSVNAVRYIIERAVGHAFLKNWDEQRAAQHYTIANGFMKVPKKIDAAQAMQGKKVLAVRADVYGTRRGGRQQLGYNPWYRSW